MPQRCAPVHDFSVMTPELHSVVTGPDCGVARAELIPTNACIRFYECVGRGELLRPKHGDCCVFCSYATVKFPPVQAGECCASRDVNDSVSP